MAGLSEDSLPYQVALVIHVFAGLTAVIAGATAALSRKGRGRHSTAGTVYYLCLTLVFLTAFALASKDWSRFYYLPVLGSAAFGVATVGRTAMRQKWRGWLVTHICFMSTSYTVLLTAFYVDNGPKLPLWRELPQLAFWFLPAAVGAPLIVRAVRKYQRDPRLAGSRRGE